MEIKVLSPRDLTDLIDLRARAFGPPPGGEEQITRFAEWAIGEGRVLGCYDGPRLVAGGRFHDMTQWWHGAPVPMAGVASVFVAPEDRGRGVGQRLMTALLDRIAERGYPLSALYPATTPLYRKVGYEHAGAQHVITLDTDALRRLGAGASGRVALRRPGPDDAAEVLAVIARDHGGGRASGPITWNEDSVRALLSDGGGYSYLAADGYLGYGWNGDNTGFVVHRVHAASAETARALWSVVGSGSSTAKTVRACVSPHDPLWWLLGERSTEDVRRVPWMLRVVDAPGAIARRGFPAGVTAEAVLAITDPLRADNTGTWRLTVADGRGRLEPAGATGRALRLGPRGLAALYAGIPLGTLRRAGLVAGGEAADTGGTGGTALGVAGDAALEAAFAATPYMLDYF